MSSGCPKSYTLPVLHRKSKYSNPSETRKRVRRGLEKARRHKDLTRMHLPASSTQPPELQVQAEVFSYGQSDEESRAPSSPQRWRHCLQVPTAV